MASKPFEKVHLVYSLRLQWARKGDNLHKENRHVFGIIFCTFPRRLYDLMQIQKSELQVMPTIYNTQPLEPLTREVFICLAMPTTVSTTTTRWTKKETPRSTRARAQCKTCRHQPKQQSRNISRGSGSMAKMRKRRKDRVKRERLCTLMYEYERGNRV